MIDQEECPICKGKAKKSSLDGWDSLFSIDCPQCGRYKITEIAIDSLTEPNKKIKLFKLSAYLRERTIA